MSGIECNGFQKDTVKHLNVCSIKCGQFSEMAYWHSFVIGYVTLLKSGNGQTCQPVTYNYHISPIKHPGSVTFYKEGGGIIESLKR